MTKADLTKACSTHLLSLSRLLYPCSCKMLRLEQIGEVERSPDTAFYRNFHSVVNSKPHTDMLSPKTVLGHGDGAIELLNGE